MAGLHCWVIGRGGLLGSHVEAHLRAAGAQVFVPATAPEWGHPRAAEQLAEATAAFVKGAEGAERWAVLWCAGAGVVGTPKEALATETERLQGVFEAIVAARLRGRGVLFLASSAGGAYGRTSDTFITERSACLPISDYGRAKLEQEAIVTRVAAAAGVGAFIARISNLYGPKQNLGKRQGLLSQISRHVIHHRPIHLYVPLDTLRDYLHADDCAAQIVECLQVMGEGPLTKIIASQMPATIAAVIGIYRKLLRTPPRIICGGDPLKVQQPRVMRFRSEVAPQTTRRARDLAVGIAQLHEHQQRLYRQGRLPPPSVG